LQVPIAASDGSDGGEGGDGGDGGCDRFPSIAGDEDVADPNPWFAGKRTAAEATGGITAGVDGSDLPPHPLTRSLWKPANLFQCVDRPFRLVSGHLLRLVTAPRDCANRLLLPSCFGCAGSFCSTLFTLHLSFITTSLFASRAIVCRILQPTTNRRLFS
jgi:hypothetical protein